MMKKLIIAAAVVCAAVIAQASAFDWKISGMSKVYVSGADPAALLSGTAYLFCSDVYSQSALLDAGTVDTSKAVATGTLADGTFASAVSFNYGNDGDVNHFYMVVVDGNKTFVGANINGTGQLGKTTSVTASGANSKLAATEWTKGSTFATAGWYTAAVPEPTSGLMLLIGVGLMALKRKRA